MKDLNNVTFLIPVMLDNASRARNIFLCVSYISYHFSTNIIICEQNSKLIPEILDQNQYHYEYINYSVDDKSIHRTHQLNMMILKAQTDIVVNYDCDVLLYPEQYIKSAEAIVHDNKDMVYPYNRYFINIDYKYHNTIYQNMSLDVIPEEGRNDILGEKNTVSVGGAIFFKRDSYIKAGMENENFIAWGPEDLERYLRFDKLEYNICRINGDLYHLKHPSSASSQYCDNNYILYNKLCKEYLDKNSTENYIKNNFKWIKCNE